MPTGGTTADSDGSIATVRRGRSSHLYDYSGHNLEVHIMREIQLRDAKASLSAVVDEAMRGQPAVITRHGKRQVVVVSYEEWERLSHVPTFGRLLMAAPLMGNDLPDRNRSGMRKANL
jgi:antitoxin Phd